MIHMRDKKMQRKLTLQKPQKFQQKNRIRPTGHTHQQTILPIDQPADVDIVSDCAYKHIHRIPITMTHYNPAGPDNRIIKQGLKNIPDHTYPFFPGPEVLLFALSRQLPVI
jgi:hypothetical protein